MHPSVMRKNSSNALLRTDLMLNKEEKGGPVH